MSDAPSSRDRVLTALQHTTPDRHPVDFLATPEIWKQVVAHFDLSGEVPGPDDYIDPTWESLLHTLEIDCRVISYDQFYAPPEAQLHPGAEINWWDALSRSTPNRMWRQVTPEGESYDIWGHHLRIVENPTGAYEEFASWPLADAETVSDVAAHPWPDPEWWDFSGLPDLIQQLNTHQEHHIRFRAGSVFELAWQLRGMEKFMMDLALAPDIPESIMTRICDVVVANLDAALKVAGDSIDMVYFYDDVAAQNSLMVSKDMWSRLIKPHHQRIIDTAKAHGKAVMYHCDGALRPLLPELIDMGIDVLNPIQADAPGMEPADLKAEFGDQLSFHGGINIIDTLPNGTPDDVQAEVTERFDVLGNQGGYILASSHHIQSDTPLENVLAMYDINLRTNA